MAAKLKRRERHLWPGHGEQPPDTGAGRHPSPLPPRPSRGCGSPRFRPWGGGVPHPLFQAGSPALPAGLLAVASTFSVCPFPGLPQVPPTWPAARPGLARAPRGCTSAPAPCPAPTSGVRPLPCPQVCRTLAQDRPAVGLCPLSSHTPTPLGFYPGPVRGMLATSSCPPALRPQAALVAAPRSPISPPRASSSASPQGDGEAAERAVGDWGGLKPTATREEACSGVPGVAGVVSHSRSHALSAPLVPGALLAEGHLLFLSIEAPLPHPCAPQWPLTQQQPCLPLNPRQPSAS